MTPRLYHTMPRIRITPAVVAATSLSRNEILAQPRQAHFHLSRSHPSRLFTTPHNLSFLPPIYNKMADHQCPTPTAMLIGTAIISIATGYMLGMASSLGFLPNPFAGPRAPKQRGDTRNYNDEEESSEEEIDDGVIIDHAPNWANGEEADKRDGLRASALKKRVARENGVSGDETPKAVQSVVAPGTRQQESVKERRRRELREARVECERRGWDVNEDFKMVFVVRRDIAISIGKLYTQSIQSIGTTS